MTATPAMTMAAATVGRTLDPATVHQVRASSLGSSKRSMSVQNISGFHCGSWRQYVTALSCVHLAGASQHPSARNIAVEHAFQTDDSGPRSDASSSRSSVFDQRA